MRLRLLITLTLLAALLGAVSAAPGAQARAPDKIYGGTLDAQQNNQWIAGILRHPSVAEGDGFQRQYCGGSLVAAHWVLTAAHCVVDEDGQTTAPGALQVLVGTKNLNATDPQFSRDILEVKVHPKYDSGNNRYDAALLRLSSDVSFMPVPIARPDQTSLYKVNRAAYVAGWGDRRADDDPRQLFPVDLYSAFIPNRTNSVCRRDWEDVFTTPSQFCAGFNKGRPDTCRGDSGGPIAIRKGTGADTRWILTGITSYGRCGVPFNIGVYTRLAAPKVQSWYVPELGL